MLADWSRFQRTCVNLLENAIRFSPPEGEIFVKAEQLSDPEHGDCILVTIDDQGQGIDKQKQALIFEKFYTTSVQRGNERRGVGLGLTFSKMVVEAHGGEIWVESPYVAASGAEVTGGRFRFAFLSQAVRNIVCQGGLSMNDTQPVKCSSPMTIPSCASV